MLTAMGDVMRKAYEKGWITTRDGNVSVKMTGKDILYITPSGWRKTIIHPEHIIKVRFVPAGLEIPEGTTPSGELHMHSKLQRFSIAPSVGLYRSIIRLCVRISKCSRASLLT